MYQRMSTFSVLEGPEDMIEDIVLILSLDGLSQEPTTRTLSFDRETEFRHGEKRKLI